MSFVKRVAGAAIRFIAEDTAEIRFSWDGVWEAGQTLQPLGCTKPTWVCVATNV